MSRTSSSLSPPTPIESSPARAARNGVWGLLLIAAIFLAYAPAWRGTFLWDDDAHVTRPELRSVEGLKRIWAEPGATQQYYPVLHSAFWLEHRCFGDNRLGYHVVSLLLHGINAWLLGILLRRLAVRGAWLAAAIFALHPVMVESVAWIAELKNTLSGAFFLGAAIAYLQFDRTRSRRWFVVALALFIGALGSKTVTATLPGALLVTLWWRRGKLSWARDVFPLIPFFALGAASGLFTVWVEVSLIGAAGETFRITPLERILIAGRVLWFYLGKLLWPVGLTFIYSRWTVSVDAAWQYLFPAGVMVLTAALWCWRRESRGPLAAALLFAGMLFPVLGFFDVYPFKFSFVADHFQYLASIAIIVPLAWSVATLARRLPGFSRWIVGPAIVAALGFMTLTQGRSYRDAETLYRDTLRKNPACWLARVNLGKLLHERGQFREAESEYSAALALEPNDATAHYSRGCARAALGNARDAAADFERAVRLNPGYAKAHYNLGIASEELRRMADAEQHLRAAVRLEPNSSGYRRSLAEFYLDHGRMADAAAQVEEHLRINPSDVEVRSWWEKIRDRHRR